VLCAHTEGGVAMTAPKTRKRRTLPSEVSRHMQAVLDEDPEGAARVVTETAEHLADDALRGLPADTPTVRSVLALYGRHGAISARLHALADRVGHGTNEGLRYLREASGHAHRAAQLLDMATDASHKAARLGTNVGQQIPPWLEVDTDEPPGDGH